MYLISAFTKMFVSKCFTTSRAQWQLWRELSSSPSIHYTPILHTAQLFPRLTGPIPIMAYCRPILQPTAHDIIREHYSMYPLIPPRFLSFPLDGGRSLVYSGLFPVTFESLYFKTPCYWQQNVKCIP